jgi:deoxycytidylate deaminase
MPEIKPAKRIGWDGYFANIAYAVSARADCTRRMVGAVIVHPYLHDIIATGYNGSAPDEPGCLTDGACPRGRHYQARSEYCACGNRWPCPDSAKPNSSYDTGPGTCIAIHAEANALLRAGMNARGCIMYVTGEPCEGCVKLIRGAMIAKVIWPDGALNIDFEWAE